MSVNLAQVCLQLGDPTAARRYLEQAAPHHLQVLKVNPDNPVYRQFYRNNLALSTLACANLGDDAGAKQAAVKLKNVGWDPPENSFDAGSFLALCIPVVQQDDKAAKEAKDRRVQLYGDEAMNLLRDAVARGFTDAPRLKGDPNLASLRQRDDFRKLFESLEKPKAEKPEKPR